MKFVTTNIDFADATYKSCTLSEGPFKEDILTVELIAWDENIIEVLFFNVIAFTYKIGCFVAGILESTESSTIEQEALARYYEKTPSEHEFKTYAIIDIEDFQFITVVASGIQITKRDEIL